MANSIRNCDYDRFPEVLPIGMKVWCECEYEQGNWRKGEISYYKSNSYGMLQWIFVEMEDGDLQEYDFRWIDVENFRNSLVKPCKA